MATTKTRYGPFRRQLITEAWNPGTFENIGSGLLEDGLDEGEAS
ncbi:MAG: hypothetical protein R6V45_07085 [Oceanipulchritudo sp.]